MYYFDNSATTLIKPPQVAEAVYHAIQNQTIGNPARGSHAPALQALRQVEQTRMKIARLFKVQDASQISFTSNATFAFNLLLKSLLKATDAVITTKNEHNSVLRPLYQLEKEGMQLDFLALDEMGRVRLDQLESLLKENTKAIIINHMSNVTGQMINLKKVGVFCQKHRILLIVDAAQSAGVVPIDMVEMHIDALCFTGHKSLYGPQGTGGIVLNHSNLNLETVFSGGSGSHSYDKEMPQQMPGFFEPGTLNVHGLAGLEAGLDYVAQQSVESIQKKLQELTLFFLEKVSSVPEIQVYGCNLQQIKKNPQEHGAIVSLNLVGWSSGDLADILYEDYDICVRSGAHCAPLVHQHFQTVDRGMVRFSFSSFNTNEEINAAIQALTELALEN
ncbi:aminotransferase class V-fold PLP-dependent enzyme [Carnobacterium funditum]|uniref:aminotransferase class V-fold PLP-dependent enzyme n=1 Tax=Carnobacterium funditum TaxID=2752 RepID=UPI0005588379|nr:aminotransferase class V-fold PLP-dependent enzyme [Carnobacterium funditum]